LGLRQKKKNYLNMKKNYLILLLSILVNISLLSIIFLKTDLFQRIGNRMGIIERKAVDRPDYWCIRGWTNTLEKLNLTCDVVFFGNSITAGSSFQNYFQKSSICNLGYPGDGLDGMLLRVKQIKAVNPKKIFLMAGINGLYSQPIQVFEEKYKALVKEIKKECPSSTIYLQSILPVNNNVSKNHCSNDKIVKANEIIRKIAAENAISYLDIHKLYLKNGEMDKDVTKDGIHLKKEYYNKWAKFLEPYIME
jgi:lysophospholipase L1-like esterase